MPKDLSALKSAAEAACIEAVAHSKEIPGGFNRADHPTSDADSVDHPDHYGGASDPYEAIKVIRAWGLGFALGNTVKYIARAGRKDPAKLIEDLKKARWYLDDEIAALERQQGLDDGEAS